METQHTMPAEVELIVESIESTLGEPLLETERECVLAGYLAGIRASTKAIHKVLHELRNP